MVQVLGASLPEKLLVHAALRKSFFGIGDFKAKQLCARVGIPLVQRVSALSEPQANAIARLLEQDPVGIGAELQRRIAANILHLKKIGSYRGNRLARGFPARGQRTRSNASNAA